MKTPPGKPTPPTSPAGTQAGLPYIVKRNMSSNASSILLVEDSPELSRIIINHLTEEGFAVTHTMHGGEALTLSAKNVYDLIILDLTLPDIDGTEVCRILHTQKSPAPILIVSSRTAEAEKVLCLDIGADDYLSKPVGLAELTARVRAILRRTQREKDSPAPQLEQEYKGLRIDRTRRKVFKQNEEVSLTATEFNLISYLASNPGQVFSREDLLRDVWGYTSSNYDHTVNTHINRLRNKIEKDPAKPVWIQTARGAGYRFGE